MVMHFSCIMSMHLATIIYFNSRGSAYRGSLECEPIILYLKQSQMMASFVCLFVFLCLVGL